MLDISIKNWGPNPFRALNAWMSHHDFRRFVTQKWNSYKVEGWGGFVTKEKFKLLKEDLKRWNNNVFGAIEKNIEKMKEEIWKLDLIDDTLGLEDYEIMRRN